jgi:2,4-dienoyl-CoA reductase-like NADH-dependent reductase (Old Yellow Enzyme family)
VIQAVRAVIPESMPVFLRISGTEWMEHAGEPSWDVPSSIKLAKLLPGLGVDLLDVSSGGNIVTQKVNLHQYYQVGIAAQIRAALKAEGLKMLIGAVGLISKAEVARSIVQDGEAQEKKGVNGVTNGASDGSFEIEDEQGKSAQADVILVARQFLREPNWVLKVADELGVDVIWPSQYRRALLKKKAKI